MKKTIVTHIFPDLDAITSVWLFLRFDSDFEEAEIEFCPSGETLDGQVVDSDPEVIHVDTGMGRFDHHHTDKRTCAAKLVFDHLKEQKKIGKKDAQALERMIELVIQVDHFENFFWKDPADDKYELCIHHLFDYLKMSGKLNDKELVYQGMSLLDAVLFGIKGKIKAEEEIKKGQVFKTKWGRAIAMETQIGRVKKLGQQRGFAVVVRKEPETGFVSVNCQPKKELDLTLAYQALKKADSKADWFFHSSRHIILNGSRHSLGLKPSRLSLEEIVNILKEIK